MIEDGASMLGFWATSDMTDLKRGHAEIIRDWAQYKVGSPVQHGVLDKNSSIGLIKVLVKCYFRLTQSAKCIRLEKKRKKT